MIQAFNRLKPFLRMYKGKFIFVIVIGLVISGCSLGLQKLSELLMKDVLEQHNMQIGKWIPYSFPVLFFIQGISRYAHSNIMRLTAEKIMAKIREELVDRFLRLNLTFHNRFESGSGGLMSRTLNDTQVMQEGLFWLADFIKEPITAIGLLAQMLYLDWRLTLGTLAFLPVIVLLVRSVTKSLRKYGGLNRETAAKVTGTLKETLDGVRVIQSFNLEERQRERFAKETDEYISTRRKIIRREEAVSPVNEFTASIAVAVIAAITIERTMRGESSVGQLTSFIVGAGLIQMPIKRIQDAVVRIQQAVVASERIFSILEDQSEVPQSLAPKDFPENWEKIEFRDVSFAYGSTTVLKNVSFSIRRGEVIALVGESGSGKSTIVNLLERFFDPSHGEILIDDVLIQNISLKDLRRNIALVTQDVFLFRDTIEQNIRAGNLSARGTGETGTESVVEAAKLANAHAFIEKMPEGYNSSVGERGGLLSGGEKQRVSIARAIFKDAPILILDEATSALDSVSELEVQKGLNRLMEGRTAFVIAHRLSTIFNADRILVMKKGELVEIGTHQQLLDRRGEYFNFYQLQMHQDDR